MPEKLFMQMVIDAACANGWLCFHPWDSRRSTPGYPDLTLCHQARGEILFCELKREGGRLSYAQMQWREAIVRAGGRFYIWRPSDWLEVERVLKGDA